MPDVVNEATHVGPKNIVLGVGARWRIVGGEVVIRLHKRFLRGFPVSRQHLLYVKPNASPLKREVREVLREHIQLLGEWCGIEVQIHKHKPLPGFAGRFLQGVRCVTDMGKVPAARHIFQGAIKMPRPAMKGAVERLSEARAFFAQQSRATVGAAIDKSFDLILGHSGDDDGVRANVVNVMVADAGNVFFAACPLPGARPHRRHFLAEKVGTGIAAGGQVGVTQKLIGLGDQRRGCGLGVGGQYLANGAALRARLTGFGV